MKKIELCKGLSLKRGDDGHWLTFKSGGQEASFNIENLVEGKHIIESAVMDWVNEQMSSYEPIEFSMKYKVGDTVLIKTHRKLQLEQRLPSKHAGKEVEITEIRGNDVYIATCSETGEKDLWLTINYFERLIEPIINTGAKAAALGGVVVGTFIPEEQSKPYDVEHITSGKPPLGIAPRKLYEEMANTSRINDLWDAMDRYVKEGCKIPPEWIDELKERYKMVEES